MSTTTQKIFDAQPSLSLRQVAEGNLKNRKVQWIASGSMSGVLAAGTIAAAIFGGPVTLIAALAIATLAALATFLATVFLPPKNVTEETQNVEPAVQPKNEGAVPAAPLSASSAEWPDSLSDISEEADVLSGCGASDLFEEVSSGDVSEEESKEMVPFEQVPVSPLFQKIATDCEALADAVAEQELTKTEARDEEKTFEVSSEPVKVEEKTVSSFRARMSKVASYCQAHPIQAMGMVAGAATLGAAGFYAYNNAQALAVFGAVASDKIATMASSAATSTAEGASSLATYLSHSFYQAFIEGTRVLVGSPSGQTMWRNSSLINEEAFIQSVR